MSLVLQVKNFKSSVENRINHNRRSVNKEENLNQYIDYNLTSENIQMSETQKDFLLEKYENLKQDWIEQVNKTNEKYRKKGNYKKIQSVNKRWTTKKKSTEIVLSLGDFELEGLKEKIQNQNADSLNLLTGLKKTLKEEILSFYKDFEEELWKAIPTMKERLVDKVIHFDEVKPHLHLTFHNFSFDKTKAKVKFDNAVSAKKLSKRLSPIQINHLAINIAKKLNEKGYKVQEPKSHEKNIEFFKENGFWDEGDTKTIKQQISMNLTKRTAWANGKWEKTERFNILEEQRKIDKPRSISKGYGR